MENKQVKPLSFGEDFLSGKKSLSGVGGSNPTLRTVEEPAKKDF